MKTTAARLFIACLAVLIVGLPSASAQRQLGKKKGPTSKLYIAESTGVAQIQTGGRIYTLRQASAFDAPGTIIETKENSRTAFVYSNGVGMTIGENSRIEVIRFDQTPFTATGNTEAVTGAEPSSSQTDLFLSRGTVGISSGQLASGSSMSLSTELGAVNIRSGNLSIVSNPDETIIDLLDGSATVVSSDKDGKSYMLQPGERVILRRTAPGQPLTAVVSQIPAMSLSAISDFVVVASNARKTVTFEVIEKKAALGLDAPPAVAAGGDKKAAATAASAETTSASASAGATNDLSAGASASYESTQEIVAKPTVPEQLPTNIVVSPDRLPGT